MQLYIRRNSFVLLLTMTLVAIISMACSDGTTTGNDTPTEAYKRLFAAVKSKETEAIKEQLSKKTIELGAMSAQRFNKPLASAYENGFTATTFSENLPNIRDERIKDDMGAVEVWNARDGKWEDLPFIHEDGRWKLAVGDAFAGTYRSPGKGRALTEAEAANAVSNKTVRLPTNGVSNRVENNNIARPSAPSSPQR
jgi:hypothetical protein